MVQPPIFCRGSYAILYKLTERQQPKERSRSNLMTQNTVNRQRTYRTRAVILRRRDFGEADRILTIYTPDHGKKTAIAKGIRKTSSRKAGHLELFTHTALLLAHARTWDIVTEAVTVEAFGRLRQQLDCIGYASYVCELIDCFTEEEDENQLLWDLLLRVLRELDDAALEPTPTEKPAALLRWFELHLLSLTGFQPELFHCLDCGDDLEAVTNYLVLHEGGIVCPRCRARREEGEELDVDTLKVLRYLQSQPWNVVSQLSIRPPILLRTQNILYRYLLQILERHLKSTEFLRRLQRLE